MGFPQTLHTLTLLTLAYESLWNFHNNVSSVAAEEECVLSPNTGSFS